MAKTLATKRNEAMGIAVRQLCERAGMSGNQLAKKLGWSQSFVAAIMVGRSHMPDLPRVAKALRVTTAELERLGGVCPTCHGTGSTKKL